MYISNRLRIIGLFIILFNIMPIIQYSHADGTITGQELGDAVYRELQWTIWITVGFNDYNHAGVYTGCYATSTPYVVDAPGWLGGTTREVTLPTFIDGKEYYGAYTVNNMSLDLK